METNGEATGGDTRRWASLTTRAKEWMTPGERWTSALILVLVGLVLAFGAPRTLTATAEPSPLAPPTIPRQLAAFPATSLPPAPPVAPPDFGPPVTTLAAAEPQAPPPTTVAPPPTKPPAPTPPAPGPCAIDTGLPIPVARTLVSVLSATQTTIAGLTGQAPPVDLASLLGSLAQCPPPK